MIYKTKSSKECKFLESGIRRLKRLLLVGEVLSAQMVDEYYENYKGYINVGVSHMGNVSILSDGATIGIDGGALLVCIGRYKFLIQNADNE